METKRTVEKKILDSLKRKQIEGYIPVSASVYKIDENCFAYNKDSDQWFCRMGNSTEYCKKTTQKKRGVTYEYLNYYFGKELCKECPHRKECFGKSRSKTRILQISVSIPKYYELSQKQKNQSSKKNISNEQLLKAKMQR